MTEKPEFLRVYKWSQIESGYNDEPVMWCNRCLSLGIRNVNAGRSD